MHRLTLTNLLRHLIAILAAILVANAITLAVYYAGYPIIALALSGPVGLLVGATIGTMINRRLNL